MTYADYVASVHDKYGEKEWFRFEKSLNGRIEYAIHRQVLLRNVREGDHVLDLGCGPGRYAIDMLRKGARVTLGDISQVQLDLARQKVTEAGLKAEGYHRLNITDLSQFEAESFDVVVCIGGALSYVHEHYLDALKEMARVLRTGGALIIAGMSIYGQLRAFVTADLPDLFSSLGDHVDRAKVLDNPGNLLTEPRSAIIHMPIMLFTSHYLSGVVRKLGFEITATATANPLSAEGLKFDRISGDEKASAALLDLEVALCERPEYRDTGEWVIVSARKVRDQATAD
jgi:ubiquinone/menaquinone biosynthesis C-methylase UbiE